MNIFATNVSAAERTIRVIVGLAVLALVFVGPRTPWAWLGLIPLLTGAIGYCPLYRILHAPHPS